MSKKDVKKAILTKYGHLLVNPNVTPKDEIESSSTYKLILSRSMQERYRMLAENKTILDRIYYIDIQFKPFSELGGLPSNCASMVVRDNNNEPMIAIFFPDNNPF